MKINEHQLQILLSILQGSLAFSGNTADNVFGYDIHTRCKLYSDIINQQSKELKEIE